MALSAVGPDGATYTFPYNTFFTVTQRASGTQVGVLQFDMSTPRQSFVLPVGNFNGALSNAQASGASWKLRRTQGGTTTEVNATLVDAQPYQFDIAEGATTGLTFRFTVAGVGDISFRSGTLDAGLAVAQDATPARGVSFSATATVSSQSLGADAAQAAAITVPSGTALPVSIALTRTADWALQPDKACAAVTARVTSTATTGVWRQIFLELDNATGQVCIHTSNGNNGVTIEMQRLGQTQQLSRTTFPASYSFYGFINGASPTPLFDGRTLSLSRLATPFALNNGGAGVMINDTTTNPWATIGSTYAATSQVQVLVTP